MHYGWRRHSEIPHTTRWTLLIVSCFAVAAIVLGVLWEVTDAQADEATSAFTILANKPNPPPDVNAPADDSLAAELEASHKETQRLRQGLADANLQQQQANAALITANERVQALEGELAAATQKISEAKSDRDEAMRVTGKMWEDRRHMRQGLTTTCAALSVDGNSAAAVTSKDRKAPAWNDACVEARQE